MANAHIDTEICSAAPCACTARAVLSLGTSTGCGASAACSDVMYCGEQGNPCTGYWANACCWLALLRVLERAPSRLLACALWTWIHHLGTVMHTSLDAIACPCG